MTCRTWDQHSPQPSVIRIALGACVLRCRPNSTYVCDVALNEKRLARLETLVAEDSILINQSVSVPIVDEHCIVKLSLKQTILKVGHKLIGVVNIPLTEHASAETTAASDSSSPSTMTSSSPSVLNRSSPSLGTSMSPSVLADTYLDLQKSTSAHTTSAKLSDRRRSSQLSSRKRRESSNKIYFEAKLPLQGASSALDDCLPSSRRQASIEVIIESFRAPMEAPLITSLLSVTRNDHRDILSQRDQREPTRRFCLVSCWIHALPYMSNVHTQDLFCRISTFESGIIHTEIDRAFAPGGLKFTSSKHVYLLDLSKVVRVRLMALSSPESNLIGEGIFELDDTFWSGKDATIIAFAPIRARSSAGKSQYLGLVKCRLSQSADLHTSHKGEHAHRKGPTLQSSHSQASSLMSRDRSSKNDRLTSRREACVVYLPSTAAPTPFARCTAARLDTEKYDDKVSQLVWHNSLKVTVCALTLSESDRKLRRPRLWRYHLKGGFGQTRCQKEGAFMSTINMAARLISAPPVSLWMPYANDRYLHLSVTLGGALTAKKKLHTYIDLEQFARQQLLSQKREIIPGYIRMFRADGSVGGEMGLIIDLRRSSKHDEAESDICQPNLILELQKL